MKYDYPKKKVGRSVFDLSYSKKFTGDTGWLYPIMHDVVYPGDVWNISVESVVRMAPTIVPIFANLYAYFYYVFVPFSLVMNEQTVTDFGDSGTWEEFITLGEDGAGGVTLPEWQEATTPAHGSLYDFLGYPSGGLPMTRWHPMALAQRGYNLTYNQLFRAEEIQSELALNNTFLVRANKEKDRFTTALLAPQRGQAPLISASAADTSDFTALAGTYPMAFSGSSGITSAYLNNANAIQNAVDWFEENMVVEVKDIREAEAILRWMETNNRVGARYSKFLQGHFGVSPADSRLDRVEIIGAAKSPIVISEVLQTSESATTPQGNMSGHGIGVNRQYIGKYRCDEHGFILGLMCVKPDTVYMNHYNRQWIADLHATPYDWYFPEFNGLGDEAIYSVEVAPSTWEPNNDDIFGYQERYAHMRTKESYVHGEFKSGAGHDFWHLGWDTGINGKQMDTNFLVQSGTNRVWAEPLEPEFYVEVGNIIRAARPMPVHSYPGG